MSDLQIVLIIIGALIIAAVLVINWWQERRFHQQVESSFSNLKSDALLDDPALDTTHMFEEGHLEDEFTLEQNLEEKPYQQASFGDDLNEEAQQVMQEAEDFTASDYAGIKDSAKNGLVDNGLAYGYDPLPEDQADILESSIASINDPDLKLDENLQKKSAQHHDIKAIFEEAFNHKKAPGESAQPSHSEALAEKKAVVSGVPAMLHAQMDLTALLYLAEETPLNKFASSLIGLFDDYDKSVFVHVLDNNQEWHLLKDASPNLTISRVACSIQLADRSGAISRHTLNRFQLAVETIGLDINAHVEWQSTGDALAVANALDAFCIEVDKTIGFHLVHGESGPFTGTKLRGLAESQGLTLSQDGTFKFLEESPTRQLPQAAFVMFNREDYPFSAEMLRASVVKSVTFQLDIPHVQHCAEAFNTMVQVARQMEIGLHATLVDDNNKVLGEMQIEKIRQQLKVIHATMIARGIVPGSASALRLFS